MTRYGDEAGFTAYATAMGYQMPAGAIGAALLRGSMYVDGFYGARFSGLPTDPTQERAWPRTGATAFGSALASDVVPTRVINASYEAALLELRAPGSLSVTVDPARRVKRQKVDAIEREFFEPGQGDSASAAPVLSAIEGLLAPPLVPEPAGIGIWVV